MQVGKTSILIINNLRKLVCLRRKLMSTFDNVKSLSYEKYGEPADVLKITTDCLQCPCDDEVIVQWLYAPVNPADINTLQGKYPSKPALPAVGGNEGVGTIVAVGRDVKNFVIGDKVVPNAANIGTWRSHAKYKFQDVYRISKCMDTVTASMLNVNPCTAYRMLKDFITLKPCDTVIQNGGNSAVGQLVIQLCKVWEIKTVNIIRDRPDIQCLKDRLLDLGADEVLTEEELKKTEIFKSKKLPAPRLALNCVCGKNALEIQKHLAHSGIMVTYGGMSREPLTVRAPTLIFKNISFKGFWVTAWMNKNGNSDERHKMFNELQQLFIEKKLQAPQYQLVPFCEYKEAVVNTLDPKGQKNVKYILDLTQNG